MSAFPKEILNHILLKLGSCINNILGKYINLIRVYVYIYICIYKLLSLVIYRVCRMIFNASTSTTQLVNIDNTISCISMGTGT